MGHREDLLEGAKRCLYEKGYARTTARDIVAASGTNLASIGYQECGHGTGDCYRVNPSGCAGPMEIAYVRGSACSPDPAVPTIWERFKTDGDGDGYRWCDECDEPSGLDIRRRAQTGQGRQALVERDPSLERRDLIARQGRSQADRVLALDAVASRQRLELLVGLGQAVAPHHGLHRLGEDFPARIEIGPDPLRIDRKLAESAAERALWHAKLARRMGDQQCGKPAMLGDVDNLLL